MRTSAASTIGTLQDMPPNHHVTFKSYSQAYILDTFLQNMKCVMISTQKEKGECDIEG